MISYLTGILFEKLFSANLPCLSQPLSRDLENFLYCTTTVLFILLSAGHCCEKQNKKNFYKMLSWIFALIREHTNELTIRNF